MADDDLMVVDPDQPDSDNASKEKQDAVGEKRKLGDNILVSFVFQRSQSLRLTFNVSKTLRTSSAVT